jgi:hypothetical protein
VKVRPAFLVCELPEGALTSKLDELIVGEQAGPRAPFK